MSMQKRNNYVAMFESMTTRQLKDYIDYTDDMDGYAVAHEMLKERDD